MVWRLRGPWLAALLLACGLLFALYSTLRGFVQQRSINDRLCQVSVSNRAATIGIWNGARTISLERAQNDVQRFSINQFFDAILEPYPTLHCVDQRPVPVLAYILSARKQPDPPVPCLPFLPVTCPPPPSQQPANPPPQGDSPPKMGPLAIHIVWPKKLSIAWEEASDDRGVVAYRLYRDGVYRASAGPRARLARFWFPCGPHVYAIEAVDTFGQRNARNIGIIRAGCR